MATAGAALNVHFGGEGTGRVTFRRIESAEDACGAARTVVSREPISTDTVYPGARPFNGPRTLTSLDDQSLSASGTVLREPGWQATAMHPW